MTYLAALSTTPATGLISSASLSPVPSKTSSAGAASPAAAPQQSSVSISVAARALAATKPQTYSLQGALDAFAAGTLKANDKIIDSATLIVGHLDDVQTMLDAGLLGSIKFNDKGSVTLGMNGQALIEKSALLAKITSNYKLNLTEDLSLEAAKAIVDHKLTSKLSSAVTVTDSNSAIADGLASLQALNAKKKLARVTFSSEDKSLNLSLKEASTASSVLAKIEGAEVTAHFSGTSKDYKIKVTASGSFTIKDLRSKSPDGAGTIKGAQYFQFSDIKTATRSGDAMIDALLMGGTNQFWHSGQSASLGPNAIKPGLMGLSSESALHELKYCFLQSAEGSATDKKGFAAMNETQKAAVEKALTYLSSLANLTFTLTTDPTQANIKFGTNKQNASAAYAYLPHELKGDASYLFLANNQASSSDFSEGSYGWEVLLHELGHAVGLKHPGNYDAGGGGTPGPYLPSAFDTRRYTIMSYNNPKDGSQLLISQNGSTYNAVSTPYNPSTYMVHDIAALQYLYGANTSAAQSGAATNLANFKGFQTLWAPNNGVIDASGQSSANLIDTRGGAYCSIGIQTPAAEALKDYPAKIQKLPSYSGLLNLGIAYGSVITSVQGGTKEDKIFANEAASSMTIDGGAGDDIAYLAGDAADWSVDQANQIYTRASTGQSITLHNIETVSFYDPATTSLMMTA